MSKKEDIKTHSSSELNEHIKLPVEEASARIYESACGTCEEIRNWYWKSINSKRRASFFFRTLSYLLAIMGAIFPLAAGFQDSCENGINFTQFGVIFLALAGLLQAADRIFGWSSGWMRYVSTVTQMEELARSFSFEWARFQLEKGTLTEADKLALFQIAENFVEQTVELQNEETRKWVVEFNSGQAVLSELIKSQKQSAVKRAKAEQDSKPIPQSTGMRTGVIELALQHTDKPIELSLAMDGGEAENFTGTLWSVGKVTPGEHLVEIRAKSPFINMRKIVVVNPGETTIVNVLIPNN